MTFVILVLACLACAGHSHRVHASSTRSNSNIPQEVALDSLDKLKQAGAPNSLNAFATLLLAASPEAAFKSGSAAPSSAMTHHFPAAAAALQRSHVVASAAADEGSSPTDKHMLIKVVKTHRHHEGTLFRCSHKSVALGGLDASFSVYVPDTPRIHNSLPYPKDTEGFPALFYLSGLTCSDENVITKANALEHCAANDLIFVAADTSPRGASLDGEDERFDFGLGAGYYLNATQEPWKRHYQMETYIEEELPSIVHEYFPTLGPDYVSLMGHSMGGMGALAIALRSPGAYRSVSALAPLSHPTAVPDGSAPDVRLAFKRFLGDDETVWQKYDPVCLIRGGVKDGSLPPPLLIDQGAEDEFLTAGVLQTFALVEACRQSAVPIDFRLRAGHDHSYFYVSSFIEEHIDFHAKFLHD